MRVYMARHACVHGKACVCTWSFKIHVYLEGGGVHLGGYMLFTWRHHLLCFMLYTLCPSDCCAILSASLYNTIALSV